MGNTLRFKPCSVPEKHKAFCDKMSCYKLPSVFVCTFWGDEVKYEEDLADAKYIRIPRQAWEDEKRRAKAEKRFSSWNDWVAWASRIDNKRRALYAPKVPETLLKQLLTLRSEYVNQPQMHFYSERSQQRELKKLEREIEACVGGYEALKRARMSDPIDDDDASTLTAESSDDEFNMSVFARK